MIRHRRTRVNRKKEAQDPLRERLRPLRADQAVTLQVNATSKHGKTQRKIEQLLILTPGKLVGMRRELILVALVPKGSAIVNPFDGKMRVGLITLGLPVSLATAIAEAITRVYGET